MLFMKIQDIPGQSEVDGYKEWIELGSLHLSAYLASDPGETGYKAGTFNLTPISSNASSVAHIPALVKKVGNGAHIPEVEIHETVTDEGEKPVKIYKLTDVTFTGLDLSASGGTMAGGGGFGMHYAKLDLEIKIIPTQGATPVSKGNIVYDNKAKKFMA